MVGDLRLPWGELCEHVARVQRVPFVGCAIGVIAEYPVHRMKNIVHCGCT